MKKVTGGRIGELVALDWPKIDFDAGTVQVAGTVIRVKGRGLIVQQHTKSEAACGLFGHPPG